ncbi:MAG: HDOD domain-containing protein [Betaproteobacteria bacterium]|nr:HDOD domain-containing protein [Betaproteobacteria bacterium]MBU6513198.1 HDOD domain-containing protein [Betaproteobacteria bacterium]MDE2153370.1 HDOD domain-containing protein [Betaproteobacteria bacterium]MDE2478262.1 HDOD domain-containing protein [Betaproteobacteria bacterium]
MGLLDIARRLGLRGAAQPDHPPVASSPAQPAAAVPRGPVSGPAVAAAQRMPPAPGDACRFFVYATGQSCVAGRGMSAKEHEVLRTLDQALEKPRALANWIPRPPAVLPRLLACLRDDEASLREACSLIRADPYLAAEILRLANSARHQHGAPVTELERAVTRVGIDGVRRTVSASLVRPLFDSMRDPLLGQALPRLWTHAQTKSDWCQAMAGERGVDAFDAYLAGLTHNLGWIGALKALGRSPSAAASSGYSAEFALALGRRSERMFGCSAEQWQISDALSRLGAALRECSLEELREALAQVLRQADAQATRELAAA